MFNIIFFEYMKLCKRSVRMLEKLQTYFVIVLLLSVFTGSLILRMAIIWSLNSSKSYS